MSMRDRWYSRRCILPLLNIGYSKVKTYDQSSPRDFDKVTLEEVKVIHKIRTNGRACFSEKLIDF